MNIRVKRTLTIVLIILAELGYLLAMLGILSEIVNPKVSYGWINVRLALVGLGMLVSPIIISHGIQQFDIYLRKQEWNDYE